MSFDRKLFGKRLKQLREEKKMTQEELGKALGITRNAISGYENGTREPDIEKLIVLSDIFECTLDYLTSKSDSKETMHYVAIDKSKLKDINVDDLDLIKELIRKLQQQ
jgi:transcriptional regulator with XRE-family HTH domain